VPEKWASWPIDRDVLRHRKLMSWRTSGPPLLGLLAIACAVSAVGCTTTETVVAHADQTPVAAAVLESCAAGTMISLDGTSCAPVGVTASALAAGFEMNEDGWGFHAVRPAKQCAGATRTVLGQTACVPIDDCDAAFPPANATVVRPASAASLASIIGAAKPGSVIALEAGTYALDAQTLTMDGDVTIIGRCARDVILTAPASAEPLYVTGGNVSIQGLTVRGAKTGLYITNATSNVHVKHVMFEGVASGVRLYKGAKATIEESVIDTAGFTSKDPVSGVVAQGQAKVEILATDVRDTTEPFAALDTGTTVDVKRSAVTSRIESDAIGLLAMVGGAITLEESVLTVGRAAMGVAGRSRQYSSARDNASIVIKRSELFQSDLPFSAVLLGSMGGGHVTLEESTLRHSSAIALQSFESDSVVTVKSSVVTTHDKPGSQATAVVAIAGARAELFQSAIVRARAYAIVVFDEGGQLTLEGSLVTGTYPGVASAGTDGASAIGIVVAKDATATLRDSVLFANEQIALSLGYSARVDADGLVVDDTRTSADGALGEGILAMDDAKLFMHGGVVRRSAHLALEVLRAGGVIESSTFERNAGGAINVWESTFERSTAVAAEPADRALLLVGNTFKETGEEVQEGEIRFTLPKGADAL
jgi:hypothetical protein